MKYINTFIFLVYSIVFVACGGQDNNQPSARVIPIVESKEDNISLNEPIDDNKPVESPGKKIIPINESLIDTTKLYWPIDCIPGKTCSIGHADIDSDGLAFDCAKPGYTGHEGIDIRISWEQMDSGIDVYAAQSGTVLWAFDDPTAYDRCTYHNSNLDCQAPIKSLQPDLNDGYTVCTELGNYCQKNSPYSQCYWCFNGKNILVIQHDNGSVAFTRYDHLKSGSVLVHKGDYVSRGQKIAEVGSAGNSTGPHLHFEVWMSDYYDLAEPFYGKCGPNFSNGLWNYENQPWEVNTQ